MISATGLGGAIGEVRLPPGEWFQVVHLSPGTIQYRYGGPGSVVSGPLYPAIVGAGPVMLHPGTEVFIQLFQQNNTVAFFHVRGGIPDRPEADGYDK